MIAPRKVAVDELRWLLEGCRPMVEAHQLLGQIALDLGDKKRAADVVKVLLGLDPSDPLEAARITS